MPLDCTTIKYLLGRGCNRFVSQVQDLAENLLPNATLSEMALSESAKTTLQNAAATIGSRSPEGTLEIGPFLIELQEECMKMANKPNPPNDLVTADSQDNAIAIEKSFVSSSSKQEERNREVAEDLILIRSAGTSTTHNQAEEKQAASTESAPNTLIGKEFLGLVREIG